MPRLKGSRRTRAPFARATWAVASTEPSSTTTTSSTSSKAWSSSITCATVCCSFSAGTIAMRRRSRKRGSAPIERTVTSEEDADTTPPDGEHAVRHVQARRQLEHARVEHRGEELRELPIVDGTRPLHGPPVPREPGSVAEQPGPAARLLAEPPLPQGEQREPELGRSEDGREQEQEPRRERCRNEDQAVALEVVLLPALEALEDVVVEHVGSRLDDDAKPALARAPAELQVLLVKEKLLREAPELAEERRSDRQPRAARVTDVAHAVDARHRVLVAAGPGEAADVHDVAARVQQSRPLEQREARLSDADRLVVQPRRESLDRTGLHHGIRVEEDEHVCVGGSRPPVATGSEAVVRGAQHAYPSLGVRDLGTRRAVVDDDHVLALQRVEAADERLAAPESHDDGGCPGHGGQVWQRSMKKPLRPSPACRPSTVLCRWRRRHPECGPGAWPSRRTR